MRARDVVSIFCRQLGDKLKIKAVYDPNPESLQLFAKKLERTLPENSASMEAAVNHPEADRVMISPPTRCTARRSWRLWRPGNRSSRKSLWPPRSRTARESSPPKRPRGSPSTRDSFCAIPRCTARSRNCWTPERSAGSSIFPPMKTAPRPAGATPCAPTTDGGEQRGGFFELRPGGRIGRGDVDPLIRTHFRGVQFFHFYRTAEGKFPNSVQIQSCHDEPCP